MKICSKCKRPGRFSVDRSTKDGFQSWCKACSSRRIKRYYRENRIKHLKETSDNKIRRKRFVYDYLLTHPCVDCGESDPVVLEFDHISGKKLAGITEMLGAGRTMKYIRMEMRKCAVRCANCHRRKTAKERDYLRVLWGIIG